MPRSERLDPDDVILCNCAGCDRELWGWRMAHRGSYLSDALPHGVEMLAGRMNGRPYCVGCLHPAKRSGSVHDEPLIDPRDR